VLQCFIDVRNEQPRGQDQAEFLYEKVLAPHFRSRKWDVITPDFDAFFLNVMDSSNRTSRTWSSWRHGERSFPLPRARGGVAGRASRNEGS